MQRTFSATRLSHNHSRANIAKSPSARGIYINEQTSKKSVNTYFHSPFKEGKPNNQYLNPSFVSSHLFYPQELLKGQSQYQIRQNYIPNQNEVRKQKLYRERLKTQYEIKRKVIESMNKGRKQIKQIKQPIIKNHPHKMQHEQLLKKQLNNLQDYRQKISVSKNKSVLEKGQALPPYLQNFRKDTNYQFKAYQQKRKQMISFAQKNTQNRIIQQKHKKQQVEKQNVNLQKTIEKFNKENIDKENSNKNKITLLGTILRQQILIKQGKHKA